MARVEIVPYNPDWPGEFVRVAAPLQTALGSLAVRIDHIGSTSVPGLCSKDVIDVQVTVPDFDPGTVAALTERMIGLGCEPVPNVTRDHTPPGWTGDEQWEQWEWEKRYFRPPSDWRATHLHVRAAGRANQRYALLFRDYLRAHPAASAGYGELKKRLSLAVGEDRIAYVETKDPVCDIIMAGANEWAQQTNWTPEPADA